MIKNKIILTCLALGFQTNSWAFPNGCEVSGFAFQQNHLVLNDQDKQTLFLIENTGQNAIEFEHIETQAESFMTPKLESKIAPSQWSAFSSDISNFYFKCTTTQDDGSKRQVNCQDVLSVCQYPRAQFPLSNKGSYWVSTNKELSQVIKEAAAKGIYLKW
jgi:hypothetical protein